MAVLTDEASTASRAARFLTRHFADDGKLASYLHTNWLAAGLYWRLEERTLADMILGYLTRRLSELAPSNLGWLAITLLRSGVPREHSILQGVRDRLENDQQADGRWVSEDGPEQDVHATLEALQALT